MITLYPYDELGHANHGWLDTRHHFSFHMYFNPQRLGFGVLRVINDDIIKAGAGFGMHPHQDMEIITYVRKGAITHKDNHGNAGKTVAGDVQVMSAGTGVFHSEYNLESEDTVMYQIWIEPSETGITPQWGNHQFPKDPRADKLPLLVSGDGNAPLQIHQDAYLYAGTISKDASINHPIKHQAYLLVSSGTLEIRGHTIRQGDGVEITGLPSVTFKALEESEVIIIDVPKDNNINANTVS
ncbi:MAG: pirin family protein [Rickettsiales bacterium]|nr:pirin family protein [Rickettsiales bacterium]